jgi:hypothetical protein
VTRHRKQIKLRNAITELWNNGASMTEMILVLGLPEKRIKECLVSARKGYDTPEHEAEGKGR